MKSERHLADTTPPITTIQSALRLATNVLKEAAENPRREARLLLGYVLDAEPEYLIQYEDKVLTIEQAAAFNRLVAERAKGVPMAYLLGQQGFYDIEVHVTPDVLIPRPETEMLVEKAIAWAAGKKHLFVVDVGTGSGIIALVLAKHLQNAHISAVDISPPALTVAYQNAEKLGLNHRVRWLQGDLLQPLIASREKADLIVANLPYISAYELKHLEVAKYEPRTALEGGEDGLHYFRRLLEEATSVIRQGGLILLEIGATQGPSVVEIARQRFYEAHISVDQDLAGHDRVVSIQL